MSRFLFVAPPFVGHVHRMRPYAEELAARGHDVAWATHAERVGHVLPEGMPFFPLPEEPARRGFAAHRGQVAAGRVSAAALTSVVLDDRVVPLARGTVAALDARVQEWSPDCLVVDVAALAGAIVARVRGLAWASSSTPALVAAPLARSDAVRLFTRRRLDPLQREHGLEPIDRPHLSPDLVLVNSVREFIGPEAELWPEVRLVGATFDRPRAETPFPWERLRDGPRVYASLGTNVELLGPEFFGTLAAGLGGLQAQVIVSAPEGLLPDPPENFVVAPFVPQTALLEHVDAVVSHGGHNTVIEALAHGRPLVLAPMAFDQPYNASRVEAAGAGVRIRLRRSSPADLRAAVRAVLDDPAYAAAARRLGRALAAGGGAAAGADALEALVGRRIAA